MNASKENKDRLFRMMAIWGEMTPGEKPSPEKMEGYYRIACTSIFTYEEIEQRGNLALKRTGFFPKVNELFNDEIDIDVRVQEDIALLEHYCGEFLFPGFYESGMAVIEMKLKEKNKEYLLGTVRRFGNEIAEHRNITSTRAQIRDALKSEIQVNQKRITSGDPEQLKLLEGLENIGIEK